MPVSVSTPFNSPSAKSSTSREANCVLHADSLHRTLSDTAAVSGITLSLARGDVLGLLGLNGAGKSTTLKMLCGMLAPDSGSVTIDGHSMQEQPLKARARIGFLPDQPPVYDDMRVHEYLRLCGQIRGLRGPLLRERQDVVTDQCSLQKVSGKLISTLSKGYRQRVGLAQAMIHKPTVLLLDEPGNGLDPQQLDAMRELIRRYASEQAVVFSTHLLSEAKSTCNRVAVIHEGRLVADALAEGEDLDALFHGAIS